MKKLTEHPENIKLVVVDIDGTIMDKRFKISDKVRSVITQVINSEVKFVLATGRMYGATVPIANELGVKTPLIVYHGSMIREFAQNDKILLHHTIEPKTAMNVIRDLRNFGVQINLYIGDEMFVEDESNLLFEYSLKRHIVYHKVDFFEKLMDCNGNGLAKECIEPIKINALHNDTTLVDKVRDALKPKYADILNIEKSMPIFCEIVSNKAGKGNAILFLAEQWGIKPSEIMVIGDQDNDKNMLSIAGLAVAMGNATENLKNIAHYITDTVENDGAARAIEKFVFNIGEK